MSLGSSGGRRPPRPAELARGLSMNGHEGRWVAVRGGLQFAARVQRSIPGPEPASYVTTGIYSTFELMLRAMGGAQSRRSCCAPCTRCAGPASRGVPRSSPTEGMGSGGRPLPNAVRCIRRPTAGYSAPTSEPKALIRTSRPRLSGRTPRRKRRTTNEVDPRGPKRVGGG